jgi:hypothetical protein
MDDDPEHRRCGTFLIQDESFGDGEFRTGSSTPIRARLGFLTSLQHVL